MGVRIVRDDLFPGGTKARFLACAFEGADEVVYASPAEGGAQTALATVAKDLGKRATIFIAKRQEPHPRGLMAKALGAKVMQVTPGYLSVVQSRARQYADAHGAKLLPFGANFPEAIDAIADAARATGEQPREVWCAAGSGVLMRGLAKAWPKAKRFAVQVGRSLKSDDVAGASIIEAPYQFGDQCRDVPPFPSDRHYDAKAWAICRDRHGAGALFWNVTGPATS